MKKKLSFFLIIIFIILFWFLIDMVKINKYYINKPFIEFNISNLNISIFKKIVNIFTFNDFSFFNKNFKNINHVKNYYPIDINKKSLLIKSNINKITTLTNNSNIYNFENWERSHGNYQSNRFSSLKEINLENVIKLKKIWEYSFDNQVFRDVQCNPIVKNGIIYVPSSNGSILSINGINGKLKWRKDGFSNYVAKRGILIETINNKDFLFFPDNKHLISLDSQSGNFNLKFGKGGKVKLDGSSVVAPVIYNNLIITVTKAQTIEAFDKHNGKKQWTYSFEDPNNNKKIYNIKYLNKGGNPWGGISLDNKRGILFLTTGNPDYYFDGTGRPGNNKFSNSVIAFDIKKRTLLWDFQETHHDIWNLDIPSPPILTTIISQKNKEKIDVVVAVTKRGNTLILDRLTGESLFDLKYKKSPSSKIKNEVVSSLQLDLTLPEPFAKNNFSINEITDRDKQNYNFVKKIISNKKYGFFEPHEFNKKNIQFNFHGGAEWMGGSVDHKKNILYVTSNNIAWITTIKKKNKKIISEFTRLKDLDGLPGNKKPWGTITAINLNNGKILWQKPFGNYSEYNFLDADGNKIKSGTENFGGVTGSEGGILFATGTLDKKLYVFKSSNGEVLWETELPFVGSSPPTIFEANGRQYVLINSTGSFSLKAGYPDKVKFGNKFLAFGLN